MGVTSVCLSHALLILVLLLKSLEYGWGTLLCMSISQTIDPIFALRVEVFLTKMK